MQIVVLGAGVIGVTTAYYLARDGHHVTVVDRRDAAGLETSYANGSQIMPHGAGPWSAPGVPLNLLRWVGKEDAPLLLRLSAIPGLWQWGPQFLRNCTAEHWRRNAQAINSLAVLSARELSDIGNEHAIDYDELKCGVLIVHRTAAGLHSAAAAVDRNAEVGFHQLVLDREGCIAVEPSLEPLGHELQGGVYSPDDRTGDCLKFTQALAIICERLGVQFRFAAEVQALLADGAQVSGVKFADGRSLRAERTIICLGSYSAPLAKQHDIDLPIYPVKGYSATVSVDGWNGAPTTSLIDEQRKIGFSRLGNRLRMAGTAEFSGFDRQLSAGRNDMLMQGLREMFPSFPRDRPPMPWTGLRPMTPDGRPVLGQTKLRNLIVNSGHGTLGWTLACGSARLVADVVRGSAPVIPIEPFTITRGTR